MDNNVDETNKNGIHNNFVKFFKNAYDKAGYLDKYGDSVIMTVLTLLTFFVIYNYLTFKSKIKDIRNNWSENKCKPSVMPFAGLINENDDVSSFEFASNNFKECNNEILSKIVRLFTAPSEFLTSGVISLFSGFLENMNSIRSLLGVFLQTFYSLLNLIKRAIDNIMTPFKSIVMVFIDIQNKLTGILTSAMWGFVGLVMTLKSFLGGIIEMLVVLLLWGLIFLGILWVLSKIPFIGLAIYPILIILLNVWTYLFGTSTLIYLFATQIMMVDINLIQTIPNPMDFITCFDRNTVFKTTEGNKKISELKTGMKLKNKNRTSTINAVMKLKRNKKHKMYKLGNIVLSEYHKVKYGREYIYVNEHPDAKLIENYDEDFLYCLNVSDKKLRLDGYTFLDWDEIEKNDLDVLKRSNYMKKSQSYKDIHSRFHSGFVKEMKVKMNDGSFKSIGQITVGDILYGNNEVFGEVNVNGEGLKQSKFNKDGKTIVMRGNNNFKSVDDLEIIRKYDEDQKEVEGVDNKLFHLLTENKTFILEGDIVMMDYDSQLLNIFERREKYFNL